jgi:hypothetical protein
MVKRQRYFNLSFWIAILITAICLTGLIGIVACEGPLSPVSKISTTLNEDGQSGTMYFETTWSLEDKTYEEYESVQQSVEELKSTIESLFGAKAIQSEDPLGDFIILTVTVDFSNTDQIEGILATVYGRGQVQDDISMEILGPYYTELNTKWQISMTVNPENIPHIEDFTWKINMPAEITDVTITPDEANVSEETLGSNSMEFTFEPVDRFVTVSVKAEESKVMTKIFWPIVIPVAVAVLTGIIAYIRHQIVKRKEAE